MTPLISSDENALIPFLKKNKIKKGKKNTTYWLIMLHLADGLVNVAFQLLLRRRRGSVVQKEQGVRRRMTSWGSGGFKAVAVR